MKRPLVVLAIALVACGGDSPRTSGDRPPSARLIARNLVLYGGATNAVRIGFDAAEPFAQLIATFRPDDARVSVCALITLDAAVQPAACRADVRSGVRDEAGGPGARALAIVLDGNGSVPLDVVLEFAERSRRVEVRLPVIPPAAGDVVCEDNACNPLFEIQPYRGGSFTAAARWDGPESTFVLLQGRVLARAQSATGSPYREEARAEGRSPLDLRARISGDEHALVLRHGRSGNESLRNVSIDARWP